LLQVGTWASTMLHIRAMSENGLVCPPWRIDSAEGRRVTGEWQGEGRRCSAWPGRPFFCFHTGRSFRPTFTTFGLGLP
jgi:hypothetical protein